MEVGRIYKLTNTINPSQIYIGSTVLDLKTRLNRHKSQHKRFLNGKIKGLTSSYKILEKGDVSIKLIEEFDINSRKELRKREHEIICNTENCINKNGSYIEDMKEYQKNYQRTYQPTYRRNNEEKIRIYQRIRRAIIKNS